MQAATSVARDAKDENSPFHKPGFGKWKGGGAREATQGETRQITQGLMPEIPGGG